MAQQIGGKHENHLEVPNIQYLHSSNLKTPEFPSRTENGNNPYRLIFEEVNDGIFVSNPETGQFIEINQPGCRMFGYEKDEIIGRDVDSLSAGVHPYTRQMAIQWNEKAQATGEPQMFEWLCRTKGGDFFWAEISLRYLAVGHQPIIVAVIRNVTKRKQLDTSNYRRFRLYDGAMITAGV